MTTTASEKKSKPVRCIVVSDKMQKSRVGRVDRWVKHPVVGKYIRRTTKVMFHDDQNLSRMGDEVLVVQTRPKSCHKNFELKDIIKKFAES